MKKAMWLVGMVLVLSSVAFGQEDKKAPAVAAPMTAAEQKFKDLLTNVTMQGRSCPINEGELGPEKEDKYVIVGVSKVKGDSWIIQTKMKYRDQEIVAPLPIEVKFTGDTPMIVVDKLTVPGGGTYSARVLFFGNTYAGSWTGGDHSGLISGVIRKN